MKRIGVLTSGREKAYNTLKEFKIENLIVIGGEWTNKEEADDFVVSYYKWRSSKLAPKIKAIMKLPGQKVFLSIPTHTECVALMTRR